MNFKKGIKEKNVVVKCGADMLLPFALVFGIYIILFGTVSPGGGFQGGVLAASAAVLIYLAYGHKTVSDTINMDILKTNEAIGATLYVVLALCGLVAGLNFCRNIFFDIGKVGDLISAGTITFMGYSVGYKVMCGVGFLVVLMVGLLAPDGDDDYFADEEDEEE